MAAFEPQEATWLSDWTIFFVADADAGTIVLGSMSAGGVLNPKRLIKLTWGAIMGVLAAILLLAGGWTRCRTGRSWPLRRSRY